MLRFALLATLCDAGSHTRRKIWLTAIQPFTSEDWPAGLSMRIGAQIMLEEILNNPALLPGYSLDVMWQNGECEPTTATDIFWHNLLFQTYDVFVPSIHKPLSGLDVDRDGSITSSDTKPFTQKWASSTVDGDVNQIGIAWVLGQITHADYNGWFNTAYSTEWEVQRACNARSACKGIWQRNDNLWRMIGPGSYTMAYGIPDDSVVVVKVKTVKVSPAPVGLLGPGCSAAAKIVAGIAFKARYPAISNSATRPSLSDRTQYPNFFRTLAPDSSFCAAWAGMTKMLGMSKMVIVAGEPSNWGSMATLLAQEARRNGIQLMGNDLADEIPGFTGLMIVEDLKSAADYVVADLKRLNQRMVALLMFHRRAMLIMCEAYKMGFKNAVYLPLWSSFADSLRAEEDETECSAAELTTIAAGSITADRAYWRDEAGLDENRRLTCARAMTAAEFKTEWFRRHGGQANDYSKRPEGYMVAKDSTSTADAVCMFALMLHEMIITRQHPVEELAARTATTYAEIQQILSQTDFEGVQGRIRFKPNSADPEGSHVILQQVHKEGKLYDIASFASGVFSFFGRARLVFGFEGEDFYAGPDGASSISARIDNFQTCPTGEILNMETNTCEPCGEEEEFDADSGTCISVKETGLEAWHVAVPIAGIIVIAGVCLYVYRFHMKGTFKKLELRTSFAEGKASELEKELKSLKDSVVGVRVVEKDYVPNTLLRASGSFSRPELLVPFAVAPQVRTKWYWQEDAQRLSAHNPHDVFQPGNFVSYAGSVTSELEERYTKWMGKTGPTKNRMNLSDRIASTGTEQKAFAADSGVDFEIDFEKMVQKNIRTGYERQILRREMTVAPPSGSAPLAQQVGATKVVDIDGTSPDPPAELAQRGEDFLVLHAGQLVQVSKQRSDGWSFGSVVYDEVEERPAIPQEGMSSTTGWFPMDYTAFPSNSDLQKFQKAMGGKGADVLAPPDYWQDVTDPLVAQQFKVTGPEKDKVVAFFMQTLSPSVQVEDVFRIQSFSLWQSYAVKRQVVSQHAGSNRDQKSYERVWLFHGTTEEIVSKIIQQGFNRSFCGRNATMYGKGVYFARDASYSANPRYSNPDSKGLQRVFLCRIVVGEYCRGQKDALAPDVREGHHLYDSTVDNVRDPSIFVTYHDAQAYPEYLVLFKSQ